MEKFELQEPISQLLNALKCHFGGACELYSNRNVPNNWKSQNFSKIILWHHHFGTLLYQYLFNNTEPVFIDPLLMLFQAPLRASCHILHAKQSTINVVWGRGYGGCVNSFVQDYSIPQIPHSRCYFRTWSMHVQQVEDIGILTLESSWQEQQAWAEPWWFVKMELVYYHGNHRCFLYLHSQRQELPGDKQQQQQQQQNMKFLAKIFPT